MAGLTQADGTFRLPEPRPRQLLLISGGSGITSVLAMLRTLADEQHDGDVVFLHYPRREADVPQLSALRELASAHRNVRLVLAYTRQRTDDDLQGHFHESHLAEIAPSYADAQTYLCGPPALVAAVREIYLAKGIEDALHTEEFTLSGLAPADGDAKGEIQFGDTVIRNSAATLLEQAERAGLTPEYGCRMGVCFTCTKVKTAGCTRNVRTGELHRDPDTEIQLCISAPVGNVAIDI